MLIGEKVSWTKRSRSGRTISMKMMEGKIIMLNDEVATVQYGRNNRTVEIHTSRLRTVGQKSELTDFVEAIVQANRTR